MMRKYERFSNHNLVVIGFVNENLSSDSSDSKSENLEVKFPRLNKNDSAAMVDVIPYCMARNRSKNKRTYFCKNKMTVKEHLKVT